MPNIQVKIDAHEVSDLANKFKGVDLGDILQRAIQLFAFATERYSKIASPVDTGRLRASINTSLGNLQATVAPHTNYAIFVHEGTRFIRGRPFMAIGMQQAQAEYFQSGQLIVELEKGLNSQLK